MLDETHGLVVWTQKQAASHYRREAFPVLEGARLLQMPILARKGLCKMLSTRRLLVAQPLLLLIGCRR